MRTITTLLFLTLCQYSLAEKSTRTEYYSIFGTTGAELYSEMSAKGPEGFFATTRHEYSYNYRTSMINGRCRIAARSIDMDITYTMPRWENESTADAELQARWKEWYRLIDLHEQDHGAFAESGYNDILSGWRRIGSSANCQEIRNQVEQVYSSIRARVNQQNAEYDQSTNHGQSQGVTFETLAGSDATTPSFGIGDGGNYHWWLVFAALIGLLFYVRKS